MNRFGCVILAAGASSRMGRLKQLLPLEGKPLLIRAAEAALESAAWPVVIVLGAQAENPGPGLARLPVLVVDNPAWPEGMALVDPRRHRRPAAIFAPASKAP